MNNEKIKNKSNSFANILFLFLSSLSLFLTIFVWIKKEELISAVDFIPLFIFSTLFFILLFFVKSMWKINIAIFLISSIFSIYFFELLLGLIGFPESYDKISRESRNDEINEKAKLLGISYDNRTLQEIIRFMRKDGIDAVPSISPASWQLTDGLLTENNKKIYPLGGISRRTTVLCNETGEYTIYNSDEHGFHNPLGIYKQDKLDIGLVGDSFAEGYCVKSDQNIVGQLRSLDYTVLNLGKGGGNGPLLELASIKEYLEPIKPEIVIWLYFEYNDLYDLIIEKYSPLLLKYLDGEFKQNLIIRQEEIDTILEKKSNEFINNKNIINPQNEFPISIKLKNYIILKKIRNLVWKIGGSLLPMREPGRLFEGILIKSKSLVHSWGGKLYFVYIPDFGRVVGEIVDENAFYKKQIFSIVKKTKYKYD